MSDNDTYCPITVDVPLTYWSLEKCLLLKNAFPCFISTVFPGKVYWSMSMRILLSRNHHSSTLKLIAISWSNVGQDHTDRNYFVDTTKCIQLWSHTTCTALCCTCSNHFCMRPANESRRYNVTSSLTGWAHAKIIIACGTSKTSTALHTLHVYVCFPPQMSGLIRYMVAAPNIEIWCRSNQIINRMKLT